VNAGRLWPIAIVGVLAVTVVANVAILQVASEPDHFTMEPEAYAKAVAWDSILEVRAASAALGWHATGRVVAVEGVPARARVIVTLCDRGGRPVEGALVRVEAIHNRQARRLRATLPASAGASGAGGAAGAAGQYGATLPLSRPGLWELRVDAERAGERFVTSLRADLEPAGPAVTVDVR
jgi:hypothetical protein